MGVALLVVTAVRIVELGIVMVLGLIYLRGVWAFYDSVGFLASGRKWDIGMSLGVWFAAMLWPVAPFLVDRLFSDVWRIWPLREPPSAGVTLQRAVSRRASW